MRKKTLSLQMRIDRGSAVDLSKMASMLQAQNTWGRWMRDQRHSRNRGRQLIVMEVLDDKCEVSKMDSFSLWSHRDMGCTLVDARKGTSGDRFSRS